jgi:hypothetical protein
MDAVEKQNSAPIILKYAFIKILFLTDQKKFKNEPVLRKPLRGSSEKVAIYDAGLYYVTTRFNLYRPRHFKWQFTSEQGAVDDVFQLYPFNINLVSGDPATHNDPRRKENPVDTKLTDHVIVVAHLYNAFQEGPAGEWAGARADDDTEGIRLVMDFSSVTTLPGKEDLLFKSEPWAEIEKAFTHIREPVQVDRINNRIFTASYNNASKDDVLKIRWSMNWDNLAMWQAFSEVKQVGGEEGRIQPLIHTQQNYYVDGNYIEGDRTMGDIFKDIHDSTIINKASVQNSFNKVKKEYDEETGKALVDVARFIENSNDPAAGALFNNLTEELTKPDPDKSRLKSFWSGIEKALPTITSIAGAVAKIVPLFS